MATPSEAAASALKKTIARIEQDDSASAGTPSAIDVNPDIGVASELGSEAANRFLKAKLRVLQEEMDRLAHDSNKKDQENFKLQQRLKVTFLFNSLRIVSILPEFGVRQMFASWLFLHET